MDCEYKFSKAYSEISLASLCPLCYSCPYPMWVAIFLSFFYFTHLFFLNIFISLFDRQRSQVGRESDRGGWGMQAPC